MKRNLESVFAIIYGASGSVLTVYAAEPFPAAFTSEMDLRCMAQSGNGADKAWHGGPHNSCHSCNVIRES